MRTVPVAERHALGYLSSSKSLSVRPENLLLSAGGWRVARLLVQRGARVDKLWHAAATELVGRLEELTAAAPAPTADEICYAFYQACAGGQRRTAELLLARGAHINHILDYSKSTPLGAASALETRRDTLAAWLREHAAT